MNINGMARGMMSKNYEGEKFLLHVAQTIESQLKEWDDRYEINVLKLADYEIWVKKGETYCHDMKISAREMEDLQRKSPYSLDTVLWRRLEEQGLKIRKGYGNYLSAVLG